MYAERSRFVDIDYNEVSDAAKGLIQEYFKVASKAPIHDPSAGKPLTNTACSTNRKHTSRKARSKVRPEAKYINNVFIKLDPSANSDIAVVASSFTQATSREYNFASNKPLRNFSVQGTIAKPSSKLRVMLDEHRQGQDQGQGQENEEGNIFPIPQSKSIPLKSKSKTMFRPVGAEVGTAESEVPEDLDTSITDDLDDSILNSPIRQPPMVGCGHGGDRAETAPVSASHSKATSVRPVSSSSICGGARPLSAATNRNVATTSTAGTGTGTGAGPTSAVRPRPKSSGPSGRGAGGSVNAGAPRVRSPSGHEATGLNPQSPYQMQQNLTNTLDVTAADADDNLSTNLPVLMTLVQGQLQKYMINREIVPAVDFHNMFQKESTQLSGSHALHTAKPNWISLAKGLPVETTSSVSVSGSQSRPLSRPQSCSMTSKEGLNARAWTSPSPGKRKPAAAGDGREAEEHPSMDRTAAENAAANRPRASSPTTLTITLKNHVRNVLSNFSHECRLDVDVNNDPNPELPLNVTNTNVNANGLNDNMKTLYTAHDRVQQHQHRVASASRSRGGGGLGSPTMAARTRNVKNEQVVYDNGIDIINSLTDLIQKSRHTDWLVRSHTFQEAMRLIQQAKEYNDSNAAYIAYQILRSHGEYAAHYAQEQAGGGAMAVQADSYCTAKSYQMVPNPTNLTALDGTGAHEVRQNEVVRYHRDPSSIFNGKETLVRKEYGAIPASEHRHTPGTNAKLLTAKLFNQQTNAHRHGHGGGYAYAQGQQQQLYGDHSDRIRQAQEQGQQLLQGQGMESLQLAEMTLESDKLNLSPRGGGATFAAAARARGATGSSRANGRDKAIAASFRGPSRPVSAPSVRRGVSAPHHRAVKHMAQCVL